MANLRNNINYAKQGWILEDVSENGISLVDFQYRSSINGWTCNCPYSWLCCEAHNERGDRAIIWWYYTDTQRAVYERTEDGADLVRNWNKCHDIEVIEEAE